MKKIDSWLSSFGIYLFGLVILISCSKMSPSSETKYPFLESIGSPKDVVVGSLQVPENYQSPNGKKVTITYAVLKAKKKISTIPIIHFSGGPGGESLSSIGRWVNHPLRENRDFIIFDQRGIGYSGSLPDVGPALFRILAKDLTSTQEYNMMADTLEHYRNICVEASISLDQYNTINNANDVNMLMSALGYDKYNLFGESYGTRLARYVMEKFPEKVNSVILDAPAILESDFLSMRLKHYNNALEKIFNYCETDSSCTGQYPHLRQDYFEILKALTRKPITITLDGLPFIINPQDAVYLLRYQLYQSDAKTSVPSFLNDLKNNNSRNLDSTQRYIPFFFKSGNLSMFISTERHEEFDPTLQPAFFDSLFTTLPNLPVKLGLFSSLYEASRNWHTITMTSEEKTLNLSPIPTLIFANKYDPVTPPESAIRFKKSLSNAKLFVLDLEGHGVGTGCEASVMINFLNNPELFDSACLPVVQDGKE